MLQVFISFVFLNLVFDRIIHEMLEAWISRKIFKKLNIYVIILALVKNLNLQILYVGTTFIAKLYLTKACWVWTDGFPLLWIMWQYPLRKKFFRHARWSQRYFLPKHLLLSWELVFAEMLCFALFSFA